MSGYNFFKVLNSAACYTMNKKHLRIYNTEQSTCQTCFWTEPKQVINETEIGYLSWKQTLRFLQRNEPRQFFAKSL